MSAKTDREVFFAFCKRRGVTPKLMKDSETIYILPPRVISINYFGLKVTPPQITVYFTEEGDWIGGTNWLWDTRLPWIKNGSGQRRRSEVREQMMNRSRSEKQMTTAASIIAKTKEALEQFGTYQFDDKGPHEVMDFGTITKDLRKMEPSAAAAIIKEVALSTEVEDERARAVAAQVLRHLDDWDELFEQDKLMEELLEE